MDFNQLMDLAAQNKSRGKSQDTKAVTGKNSEGKSSKSGVSDEAVKAFLAKRELEKKKKAAEEEAARRARIEERLAHSLGVKTKESGKRQTFDQSGKKVSIPDMNRRTEKQKVSEHRDTKGAYGKSSQKSETSGMRPLPEVDIKNVDSSSKKLFQKGKGKAKASGPLDFKALLAMAEENKNGGGRVLEQERRVKAEQSNVGDGLEKKIGQDEKKFLTNGQRKSTVDRKSNGQVNLQGSSKSQMKDTASKAQSLMADSKTKQVCKRPGPSINGFKDKGVEGKMSSTQAQSESRGKLKHTMRTHPRQDMNSLRGRHIGIRRDRHLQKRKRNEHMDDAYGDDDFIDDGEGEEVDVSKYIKEIFGYDRSRFCDDDDDLAGMESNFAQIEREEVKSSRIARLEDEIEQLKELNELRQHRDKLKKKAKKR